MSCRRRDNDVAQVEEDAASAVTTVEGRKRHTTVSFMDWANKSHDCGVGKRKSLYLERMGSGVSCGDSSISGEYATRFSEKGFGKMTPNGWCAEQMQIQQRQDAARVYDMAALVKFKAADEAYLRHPFRICQSREETIQYGYVEEGKRIITHGAFGIGSEGREEDGGGVENKESLPREDNSRRVHMFDKAVTPSDVGKLNRLVIPKHHAERYFPLDTNEKDKGLLLTFQDAAGKEWRFRYSYWSSSQSYVLTKGWSRFVREMKLHAGDVVSFHSAADAQNVQQFYISWKRRASKAPPLFSPFQNSPFQSHGRVGRTGKAQHPSPPPSQWMSFASPMPTAATLWAEQLNAWPPTEAAQAMSLEKRNRGREPPQFMKLKLSELPPGESSYPAENAAATEPIKRVRLFGVNL